MATKTKKIGICFGALLVIAAVVYVFVTPYNRTFGVRLGGTLTAPPADWSGLNVERQPGQTSAQAQVMQIKPEGFPPFVVNIWFVGTPTGVISATRHDGGYWGGRVHANPNATIRIGDAAYDVTARHIVDEAERKEMGAAYVRKYNTGKAPGMAPEDLANPALWEIFFWTPR